MFRPFSRLQKKLAMPRTAKNLFKNTAMKFETLEDRCVPAAFTAGDLVVLRVGTGAAALSNAGTAVFLDEYLTTGTTQSALNSVALPTADDGANQTLTMSGTATSEGLISRSADGRYLLVAGYDAAPGAPDVASSTSATNARVFGRVDATGDTPGGINTTTTTTSFSGNNIRGVTSVDGTSFWATGGNTGVVYNTLGGSGAGTIVSISSTNNRTIGVFNGQLYFSSGSGTNTFRGVNTVGSGIPTVTSTTSTRLAGLTDTTNPSTFSFFLADLNSSVAGVDTLYVADDGNGALSKFSLVGGNWTSNGIVGTTANDYRGLVGTVNGTTVTLYATRTGNELVSLTDASGYNASFSGTPTILATAAANQSFRGVAFTPGLSATAITAGGTTPYTLGGTAVPIAPSASFADVSDYNGGSLTVSGATASDTLSIASGGSGANEILVSGGSIYYGTSPTATSNFQIGTFTGGGSGANLVVTFNAASPENRVVYQNAVSALLKQITFSSPTGAGNRTITFQVNKSANLSTTATQTIQVSAAATAPTVANATPTDIANVSATLGGSTTDGGSAITSYGVIYSLTNANLTTAGGAGVVVSSTNGAPSNGAFSVSITGLTAGSTYFYRAFATNSVGTTYAAIETFVAADVPAVSVTTSPVVASTSAQLSGNVSSDGNSPITARGFVYSTSNATPTTADSTSTVSGATGSFTGVVSGLAAATQYYYRAYATNIFGTSYSSAVGTFTTSAAGVFGANSVVVLQSDSQTSAAATVSILEYLPGAANQVSAVQTVSLPTTASGNNKVLTQSGSASSEGYLSRTQNGAYLLVAGYDAAGGTASVKGSSLDRVVGLVNARGVVDTSTTAPGYGGDNFRSAASVDGSLLYVSGAAAGVTTVALGTQSTSATLINALNTRQVGVFGNQLYAASGVAGSIGVNSLGSGLPTGPVTATPLPAGTTTSPAAFYFLDRDVNVPGVDELFLVDGTSGLKKYSFDGSTWSLQGTIAGTYFGVAIAVNGVGTDIYATTGDGATAANSLVKFTDTAAYNAVPVGTSTSTVLATAAPGKAFRGVTFAPVATAPTVASPTSTGLTTTGATLGGAVTTDGGSPIIQRGVVYSLTSNNATLIIGDPNVVNVPENGTTTGVFTAPAITGLATNSAYSYRAYATNALGTTYSDVATFSTPSAVVSTTTVFPTGAISPLTGFTNTSITFTADVAAAAGSNAPTGTVEFRVGAANGTLLATATTGLAPGLTRTFTISGIVPAGTYSNINAYFIADSGFSNSNTTAPFGQTLNISTVDTTPPTVTSIDDNLGGATIVAGTTVSYTVTFNEDIDDSTVSASDFVNAGTASVSIGAITEPSPGVFTVLVTPTTFGSLNLRIPTGAVIADAAGNNLVVPVSDDTTLSVTAPNFTAGNIAFIQADASANNTTFSIVEVKANVAGQTSASANAFPVNGAGGTPLRISGSAGSTGYLATSLDGSLLSFDAVNTAVTTGNLNTVTARGVGAFNNSGAFGLQTTYTGTSGDQARGATTLDGTNWFIADQGGLYTNSSSTKSPSGNFRGIKSFGNTVYVGVQSATIAQVSTFSFFTGSSSVGLPGLTGDAAFQDFYLVSSGDNGAAFDVLYTISNAGATVGTVSKFSLVNGTWVANGTSTTTFGGFGLAAQDSGAGATLYVSTANGSTINNSVIQLFDTTGYNAAINIVSASNVTLYTAPAGKIIKGVAFTPSAVTQTVTTLSVSSPVAYGSSVTFSGTVVAQSGTTTPSGTVEIRNYSTGALIASTNVLTGTGATGSFSIPNVALSAGSFTNLRAVYVPSSGFQAGLSSPASLTVTPAAFSAGNVAALQTDEADSNSSFSIVEVNASAAAQATVNGFAINGVTGNEALRINGSGNTTGYLANDNYGGLVSFAGHNTADAGVATLNAVLLRGAGSLSPNGTFTLEASYIGTNALQARGATSIDGANWTISDQGGVYVGNIDNPEGPTTSPGVAGSFRAAKSFGGTIYISSQDPAQAIVSTFTAPSTLAALPGLTTSATFQDFYLIRSGENGSLFDVLYVVSNTTATAGTIEKYSLFNNTWVSNGSYTTTFGGFGLAAQDNGTGATLYVSTGTGSTAGNSIVKLFDTTGYNGALAIATPSNVTLYTAPAGKILKGVAFAPQTVTVTTPLVDTPTVTNIATTSVTLGGTIQSDGNSPLLGRGVVYSVQSINANPSIGGNGVTNQPALGTAVGAFSVNVAGLLPNTTYAYKVYASNSSGDGYIVSAGTFTTASVVVAPTVIAPTSANITASTVLLGGSVSSDGGATITQRGIVYSNTALNANPTLTGNDVTVVPVSGGLGDFTQLIDSLASNTGYSFVVYATNSVGTGYSSVASFTTRVPTSTAFTVSGVSPTSGLPTITPITFTATVTAGLGASAPAAGVVEFRDGGPTGTLLATATDVGSTVDPLTPLVRTFTVTSTAVPVGSYSTIKAYYIGASGFDISNTSAPFGSTLTIAAQSGPISYATSGSTYSQNFNSLPSSGTINTTGLGAGPFELSQAPFNSYLLNGWYAQKFAGSTADLVTRVSDGSVSGGALNDFGALNSTERALGSVGSSSVMPRFGAIFVNTTGAALNEITISYYGEQWRGGGNPAPVANTLTFGYQFGAADIATGSFQSASSLDFSSINLATTATAYDGNNPLNRQFRTFTLTGLNWLPGQSFAIRWEDVNDDGQDDGLAVDDFTLTAVASAPTAPAFTSAPSAQFITGLPATFTVTASGVPAATFTSPNLPAWLTLNSSTGALTGTAPAVTIPTNYEFTIFADNTVAPVAQQIFTAIVLPTKISYSAAGSNYLQNFDGLPNTGSFTPPGSGPLALVAAPVNATNIYGWSFAVDPVEALRFAVDNGNGTTGSAFSYGSPAAADRALGSLATGSNNPLFGAVFSNDTGSTLDTFTLSYTGEQWRRGSGLLPNALTFSYQINGSDIRTGAFVPVTNLDFTAPVTAGSATSLDGNDLSNRTLITYAVTGIAWNAGDTLVIRWNDINEDGDDDGLAIDDLTFSATSSTPPPSVDLFTVNGGPIQVVDKQGNTPTLVGQNSVVTQLLVTFNQQVSLDTNAFSIVNLHASVTVNTGTVAPSTEAVTVTAHPDTTGPGSPSQGYLRYYLTFSGPGVNSWHNVNVGLGVDSSFTTIKNGYYQLVTHLAQVHAGGNDLSGVAGTTDTQNNFWALFGSVAPNDHGPNFAAVGSVSLFGDEDDSSFVGMYPAFGHNSTEGTPPYTAALDVDLDGGNGSPDLFGATETSDDELDVPGIYSTFGTNWSF